MPKGSPPTAKAFLWTSFVRSMRCSLLLLSFTLGSFGLAQAPYMVRNINTAFQESSDPQWLTPFNGGVAFAAYTPAEGTELWVSDGTAPGTFLLGDLDQGPVSSDPRDLTEVDGLLFCSARIGRDLWVSDGTSSGTQLVSTFAMIGAIKEGGLVALNGQLVFAVSGSGPEDELWVSDGTPGGTMLLHTFTPLNSEGIDQATYHMHDGRLYFMGSDGGLGREVWSTDGTVAGTQLLKDIHTEAGNSSDFWDPGFITYNDTLFFTANEVGYDQELWKSDGTNTGTVRVKDITPGPGGSGIRDLTIAGGKLFFPAVVAGNSELWTTDGSAAGTVKVADVGDPHGLLELGGLLIYADAVPGQNMGWEPWRSDGTAAGTFMIADIAPGPSDGLVWDGTYFREAGGLVFFRGNNGVVGEELWSTDGTGPGTMLVKDLYPGPSDGFINNATWSLPVGNILFFDAVNDNLGATTPELWASDGTTAGTLRLTINSFGDGSLPGLPVLVGDTLFFAANNGTHGRELWALDASGITTGLQGRDLVTGLELHPVPVMDRLYVQLVPGHEPLAYDVTDGMGRLVRSGPWTGGVLVLDLVDLEAGLFVVQVRFTDGSVERVPFIKQ